MSRNEDVHLDSSIVYNDDIHHDECNVASHIDGS